MNICIECGNDYELHSTDGARCPKNQGNLVNGKLEFFSSHFDAGLSEVAQLRQALTEANALYNTVEAINLDLTERVEAMQADAKLSDMAWKDNQAALKAQAETIARLEAELAQCKHALDDEGEVCECGRPLDEHEEDGLHPCTESGCLMFWLAEAK